jgi:hypothetical protein
MASINKEASDAERWIASTWDLTPEMAALAREIEKARQEDIKNNGIASRSMTFPVFIQHLHDNPKLVSVIMTLHEIEEKRQLDIKSNGQHDRNASLPAFTKYLHDHPDLFMTGRSSGFTMLVFDAIWRRIKTSIAVHPASK